MALHFRSDKELPRLEILCDLAGGRLTTLAAAQLLGLERRQVQRLAKAYQEQGATALISEKRGQPSNRRTPSTVKTQALDLIRHKGLSMPYRTCDKVRRVTETTVIENKRPGRPARLDQTEPGGWAGWGTHRKGSRRRDQTGHMFGVG
jgi:hypothetical protein